MLNLDKLFYPRSVAVVGASNAEGRPGQVVMHNLLHGGFEGPIMPVTNADRAVAGVLAYPEVGSLPEVPDLAVVCAPAPVVPQTLAALGERGARAAILLPEHSETPAGHGDGGCRSGIRQAVERYGMRVLGPDCLGLMVPGIGLNASIAPVPAVPGGVAFVSQSSTVCAAVLDWARDRDIGFSHFLSLGETADICFGDVIDYLGNDAMTRAILLYVESIRNGRHFLSAGRGASRNKPILVVKGARTEQGQRIAFGAPQAPLSDAVYDAAIQRAGMLRVQNFSELFAAVETLGRTRMLRGDRLAIVSNGRGLAVAAVDYLVLSGGRLAEISEATQQTVCGLMGSDPTEGNPTVLDEDADPDRYAAATRALLNDAEVNAVLVLHAPTSAIASNRVAEAVIRVQRETRGAVLASFMGGAQVAAARRLFAEAKIPSFDTTSQAIEAFMHMVRFRRNQEVLMETPMSKPAEFSPAVEEGRAMVHAFLARGTTILSNDDAKALLAAYGIRSTPQSNVPAPDRVGTSRSEGPERSPWVRQVRIGVADDPVFGPFISFGHGGPEATVIGDQAVALPPLNMSLARELVSRTRVFRLLEGYGPCPPANLESLCLTLVRVSQMIVDLPEIAALEINPLLVGPEGTVADVVQILVGAPTVATERRLAIRPYPKELEETFNLLDGREVLLRPIRPEDEPAHHDFINLCTPEDMRLRFFHIVHNLPHAEMARLTQIDYDREMAFIATAPKPDGSGPETLGVVRVVSDVDNDTAEYAILVRSDIKGQRLGGKFMEKIVCYCRSRSYRRVIGHVLRDNRRMLDLVHSLGFKKRAAIDDDIFEVELDLDATPA